MSQVWEVNFDGLVGPTHNYGGLARGNLASGANAGQLASPRQAALQGLAKMKALADLGLKQAVLPPHDRPHLASLRRLGFTGRSDAELLAKAIAQAPELVQGVYSASNMWVANAATVSPFADTIDNKTHFTAANLSSMFHRSIEAPTTERILRSIFVGDDYVHHPALPAGAFFADEGAANHTRFCHSYGQPGVELFVYGASAFNKLAPKPERFPARQTLEASQAIARHHRLAPERTVFAQQHPAAIDAGVFHNDVIAVGDSNLLFYHQLAFLESESLRSQLNDAYRAEEIPGSAGIEFIEVPALEVPIEDAVNSYLFNSQLLRRPGRKGATIVVPMECMHLRTVHGYLEWLQADHPAIDEVLYFDLKQSMRNGGGPACLRLRVVMSEAQINQCPARVFLDDALYGELVDWVNRHYRDELGAADLADPALMVEVQVALSELVQLLQLQTQEVGPIYDFQR
ncbi:N-succinylarginine dihydrolase [Halioxenophilus sp. WMMB6]|uniref:N-succinylarginine dihydrolase n=1 Tax=Halioxenophilus sp. WMMB6 TaxID=3073815 RepID=UPI00295ED9A3|nr:N-succinylarginine dihydrolase [Halioxenophilus sp. WMMB6]